MIDYINPYVRVQGASTFGLEQGGSCKRSAWIENHVYASTAEFFITKYCSANCMTIIRQHAFVFASLYMYHLHGCCLIPSNQAKQSGSNQLYSKQSAIQLCNGPKTCRLMCNSTCRFHQLNNSTTSSLCMQGIR